MPPGRQATLAVTQGIPPFCRPLDQAECRLSLGRCLRQVGGVTGAIPVGILCLAFLVLVVPSVLKNALLSMHLTASQAVGKEKGGHMKYSLKSYFKLFIASVSDVSLGLGTSILASAALT